MSSSIIIPTYNRMRSLQRTLESLELQTTKGFEVLVVDDGSTDGTCQVSERQFRFPLKYLKQRNSGATVARNNGVLQSRGDVLIFVDDDVSVSPETVTELSSICLNEEKTIATGTIIPRSVHGGSVFSEFSSSEAQQPVAAENDYQPVHFAFCNTELLAVRREDFRALGGLEDPTGGWPNWDDVDFGYRAYLAGYQILRSSKVIGEHWDYSLADLETSCQRWQRASKSAVRLFQRHPLLIPHLPMFRDSLPINRQRDSYMLLLRKLLRRTLSSSVMMDLMTASIKALENHYPSNTLLGPLYRWVTGGYIYRGFQEGLEKYGGLLVVSENNSAKCGTGVSG